MTTAHRPTFDPARGKDAQRGPAYHQRLQPAHKLLKTRQPGQGGAAGLTGNAERDLRTELLAAEAAHFAKKDGRQQQQQQQQPTAAVQALPATSTSTSTSTKRTIDQQASIDSDLAENSNLDPDPESESAKRRKILEDSRDIDADDSDADSNNDSNDDSDDDDDDDSEDETAELMRELEKIKRERADAKAREEADRAAQEQDRREEEIAYGNPLLNSGTNGGEKQSQKDFGIKRRWDDDVVFKNQARGTETKTKKEFVNDLLRSDFHKKFMGKYVR